ncbi:RluA family pseudouridine synthase, partial [Myxococcus sp. 1LA]
SFIRSVLAAASFPALASSSPAWGSTHQIRVQRSEAGFPVLRDSLYGPPGARTHAAAQALGRQALHAFMLELPSPATGQLIRVEAPLPEDFLRALAVLRGG